MTICIKRHKKHTKHKKQRHQHKKHSTTALLPRHTRIHQLIKHITLLIISRTTPCFRPAPRARTKMGPRYACPPTTTAARPCRRHREDKVMFHN